VDAGNAKFIREQKNIYDAGSKEVIKNLFGEKW
jgi:hypothetical protein